MSLGLTSHCLLCLYQLVAWLVEELGAPAFSEPMSREVAVALLCHLSDGVRLRFPAPSPQVMTAVEEAFLSCGWLVVSKSPAPGRAQPTGATIYGALAALIRFFAQRTGAHLETVEAAL